MSKNIGTLISAAIRPVDSSDLIATAYASEIMGGLHSVDDLSARNAIIFERREWGMMCYVKSNNKTYQLTWNYSSTSILDNLNWVEFSGSGGSGGSEWLDSVLSVLSVEPLSPIDGDRYLLGNSPTGTNWSSLQAGLVVQWNSAISTWQTTIPTDGTSLVVDNEDGAIYRYETYGGLYPFPLGTWQKERVGQVRDISATTANGISYVATSNPYFNTYVKDMIFLTKFSATNVGGTVSLNINGLGSVQVKKPTPSGLSNFNPLDIEPNIIYNLVYDGTYFQLNRTFVNEDLFNVKYYVEPTDYIVVPEYYQYWVYSDLEIAGNLVNFGHVIIANGSLIMSGGTFSNFGSLVFVNMAAGLTTSYNTSDTIQFTQSNTVFGLSVSAIVKDGSLTASKLDTGSNGGATAGYLLSVDSSGNFSWIDPDVSSGVLSSNDKNFTMTFDTVGDGQFTGLTISQTPLPGGYVGVFVNGQEFEVGFGQTLSVPCYFSDDGGSTGKSNIVAGDGLYWNASSAEVDLYTDWRISLYYIS